MNFSRQILLHLLWLLPLAFWPGSNSYDAVKFTILAIAVSLWLGHGSYQLWRGKSDLLPGNQEIWIWGSLVLLLGAGIFHSSNPTLIVRTGLLMTFFAMVTFQTSRLGGDLSNQVPLLITVTLGASLAALYGLMQMAHLVPGAPSASGYPPGISTLGNQNYLAGLMAASLWPALVLLRNARMMWLRIMATIALILILTTLALAGAAGPQMAVLVTAAILIPCVTLVVKNRASSVPLILAILILAMTASGYWLLFSAPLQNKLLAENHGETRRTDWLSSLQMVKQEPIVGVGAGNYLVQWPQAKAQLAASGNAPEMRWGAPISTRAHNDFLQWMAETGVLGVVWLSALMIAFARTWRRKFLVCTQDNQINYLLLTAGLITVSVHSMVSFPFHLPATSLVFAFSLGLLLLDNKSSNLQPSGKSGKLHGLILASIAIALALGSLQEFRGDLKTSFGRYLFTQGKTHEAVDQLDQGIQLKKWPGHGHLYLGLAQTALGNQEAAEFHFQHSINDRPSFEAYLALAESEINKGNYSKATDYLNLVNDCGPERNFSNQIKFLKAIMAVRQGQLNSAHKEFEQLLSDDPSQHRALLGLGYIEVKRGHPELAKDYYRQAIVVIDRKATDFRINPGQESAALLVQLQQNRQVASKALNALTNQP